MNKLRCQISFCPETERDIIDYLKHTKKSQRHYLFQNAIRMLMQTTGYYSRRQPVTVQVGQEDSTLSSSFKDTSNSNKEDKRDIVHMFDEFH